jgi:transposase
LQTTTYPPHIQTTGQLRTANNHTTTEFRISDELWAVLQPLLPVHVNTHRTGGGRPRVPDRDCVDAIFYVLRTGCHWQALDQTGLCAYWTAYERFQEWMKAGVFLKLWQAGVEEFEELDGVNWDWLSMDEGLTKAQLGGGEAGFNSTSRGKGEVEHVCYRCRHKHLERAMRQVSLQDGEYRPWTADHAAYFRRCRLKRPALTWLCGICYRKVQRDKYQRSGW